MPQLLNCLAMLTDGHLLTVAGENMSIQKDQVFSRLSGEFPAVKLLTEIGTGFAAMEPEVITGVCAFLGGSFSTGTIPPHLNVHGVGMKLLFDRSAMMKIHRICNVLTEMARARQFIWEAGCPYYGPDADKHTGSFREPQIKEYPVNWKKLKYPATDEGIEKNSMGWYRTNWVHHFTEFFLRSKLVSVRVIRVSQTGKSCIVDPKWSDNDETIDLWKLRNLVD